MRAAGETMAYDLEEQEQLAELKAWWNKYGNFILTVVTVVLLGFAAYNGWQWYQREQASQAAGVYGQLEKALAARDVDKVGALRRDADEQVRQHRVRADGSAAGGEGAGRSGQRRPRARTAAVGDRQVRPGRTEGDRTGASCGRAPRRKEARRSPEGAERRRAGGPGAWPWRIGAATYLSRRTRSTRHARPTPKPWRRPTLSIRCGS